MWKLCGGKSLLCAVFFLFTLISSHCDLNRKCISHKITPFEYEPSLNVAILPRKHSGALLISILCTEASECQTRWLSEIVPVRQVTERERLIKLSRPDFLPVHMDQVRRASLTYPAPRLHRNISGTNCTNAPKWCPQTALLLFSTSGKSSANCLFIYCLLT